MFITNIQNAVCKRCNVHCLGFSVISAAVHKSQKSKEEKISLTHTSADGPVFGMYGLAINRRFVLFKVNRANQR